MVRFDNSPEETGKIIYISNKENGGILIDVGNNTTCGTQKENVTKI